MTMTIRGARLLAILALFGALLFSGAHARTEVAACTPVVPTIGGFVVPNAPATCTDDASDEPVATGDEGDPDVPAMPADPADPADPDAPAAPAAPEDGDGDEG